MLCNLLDRVEVLKKELLPVQLRLWREVDDRARLRSGEDDVIELARQAGGGDVFGHLVEEAEVDAG
ncbi:hypothetical protein Enr13x_20760 [Stieleria neptunia]|uniref:Uncharacterized protein n=1 Tax=Stieleria neptunia TaxID=2527979 RepID=A0A518HN01_9BACT|nr:hypothetical protein Enr13x_20760 [Stieleria neptunia]